MVVNCLYRTSFQMHSFLMDFEVIKNMTYIYLFEFINKIHMQFVLALQTNHGVMTFRRQSTHFQYRAQIVSQYPIEVVGRQVQEFGDKLKFNF